MSRAWLTVDISSSPQVTEPPLLKMSHTTDHHKASKGPARSHCTEKQEISGRKYLYKGELLVMRYNSILSLSALAVCILLFRVY